MLYFEEYKTKSEAMKREYSLKRIKNKAELEKTINKII
jgi:predicted GIY-YIG superfamily endonuclease